MTPPSTSSCSSWNWTWRREWRKSTPTWPVPQTQRTCRLCSTLWQTSSSKKTLKIAVSSKQLQSEKRCVATTSQHCGGLCWVIGSIRGRPLTIQCDPRIANHIWQSCVAKQLLLTITWANKRKWGEKAIHVVICDETQFLPKEVNFSI